MKGLVLLRQDIRLDDNPALMNAFEENQESQEARPSKDNKTEFENRKLEESDGIRKVEIREGK